MAASSVSDQLDRWGLPALAERMLQRAKRGKAAVFARGERQSRQLVSAGFGGVEPIRALAGGMPAIPVRYYQESSLVALTQSLSLWRERDVTWRLRLKNHLWDESPDLFTRTNV